jgi:2-oxoglutarate ferredoxin oxidoreductase subunit alpha
LLTTDLGIAPARLAPVLHFSGMPITARFIVREIASRLRRPALAQTLERVS